MNDMIAMSAAPSEEVPSRDAQRAAEERLQFRLERMQLFNWGTFADLHSIPVSRAGHLVLGPSGSGKSTILDAKTALLAPTMWMEFNLAAKEGNKKERDRDLMTYVRGAWSKTEGEEGSAALEVLRKGTTWSALGMTLSNEEGQKVTLAQLFWIRGSGMDSKSVQRHFLVVEREFDLMELEFFAKADFNVRKLKQALGAAYSDDTAAGYRDCFMGKLGIPSEQALKLLHKAQSTKNISDLNAFMRELMLEKPDTFKTAKALVDEFVTLNDAHQAMVKAGRQIKLLVPARENLLERDKTEAELHKLRDLDVGHPSYTAKRKDDLLTAAIAYSFLDQGRLEALEVVAKGRVVDACRLLEQLRKAVWSAGGERLDQLHVQVQALVEQRELRLKKRHAVAEAFRELGQQIPDSADTYATAQINAQTRAQDIVDGGAKQTEAMAGKLNEETRLLRLIGEVADELKSLVGKPSNIPGPLRALRGLMSGALQIPEVELPFAGELMEVLPTEQEWRPALERLLGGLSTSMLVPDQHYDAVLRFVDERNLRMNFSYHHVAVSTQAAARGELKPAAAARKLQLKSDPCRDWLEAELRSNFNHVCLESREDFRREPFALSKAGQIRGGRSRHRKDDRSDINNPENWSLGWDNSARQRHFREKLKAYQQELEKERSALKLMREASGQAIKIVQSVTTISNTGWTEIDVADADQQLKDTTEAIRKLELEDPELKALNEQFVRQEGVVKSENFKAADSAANVRQEQEKRGKWQQQLDALRSNQELIEPSPFQIQALDERYASIQAKVTLDELDRVAIDVQRRLSKDMEGLRQRSADLKGQIELSFKTFKMTPGWEMDAADMDETMGSADAFLALLEELERDKLPACEARFFAYLQTQSDQNLATLSAQLASEAKQIEDRIDSVNEALKQVPFSKGTHLQIESRPVNQKAVQDFKKDLKDALSQALTTDREAAERRFLLLQRLVERFASTESSIERWRQLVLDVRQHVEFRARELGEDGRVELYEGGSGKSGGQRQKLTTTCLAAALRFQLVGEDQTIPAFAPVVIDEAFDKADHEFSSLAMGIFRSFGFQIIVATPMKSVTTFEPFIGGATLVSIRDRRHSSARHLTVTELMDVARSSRVQE